MYFIDALYGKIELDVPPEIIKSPELQRLREVRLCNINSPFITGGTTLNRFEHAIGTAYLAQEIVKKISRNQKDQEAFIIAALLHDIVTAPFGHSLEYLYESLQNNNYEHANIWQMMFSGKTVPSSRNYFVGQKLLLPHNLKQDMLIKIRDILEMKHPLSKFLTNNIDIDNIDNVFRFAFHIGITFDRNVPLLLARDLQYQNNELYSENASLDHFEEWFNIRRQLYEYLLEDEGEFVAKALLERALIECFKDNLINEFDWVLTDAAMVELIITKGNPAAKNHIQKLMLMDFPEQRRIYFTQDYRNIDRLLDKEKLRIINFASNHGVLLHFIRDVNKTCRQLLIKRKNEQKAVGYLNDRYLIGLFSENMHGIKIVEDYLKNELKIDLVGANKHASQTALF